MKSIDGAQGKSARQMSQSGVLKQKKKDIKTLRKLDWYLLT
jgi:hypothetical protein